MDGVLDQYDIFTSWNPWLLDSIICRYLRYVKPSYDNFVLPTAKYADIVSALYILPAICSTAHYPATDSSRFG